VKRAAKRSRKVPIPIVDAVVEVVFARLAEAAAKAKKGKRSGAKTSARHDTDGLAGAVADLLLAGLSREASKGKTASRARPRKRPAR
jgi:hypothetical protein